MSIVRKLISLAKYTFTLFIEYATDFLAFAFFSGQSPTAKRNKRIYYNIIIDTHTVEKGLSLKNCRPLFGQPRIYGLMKQMEAYDAKDSKFPIEMATGALNAYVSFHRKLGVSDAFIDQVDSFTARITSRHGNEQTGGLKDISGLFNREQAQSLPGFLEVRASCRRMKSDALPRTTVEELARLAQGAPSQCNRQATRIHVYQDPAIIARLLDRQGGARGFADEVGNLIVVSSEITAWKGANQRNQMYVDGGIYIMSLLASAQALGLASCPLNLATTNATEREIKKIGGIPADERLITMIAVGHADNGQLFAAKSPRLKLDEFLSFH